MKLKKFYNIQHIDYEPCTQEMSKGISISLSCSLYRKRAHVTCEDFFFFLKY